MPYQGYVIQAEDPEQAQVGKKMHFAAYNVLLDTKEWLLLVLLIHKF